MNADDRLEARHLADQLDALAEQVGLIAFFCAWRSVVLMARAEKLQAGPERSETAARALAWFARAQRWRRDRARL